MKEKEENDLKGQEEASNEIDAEEIIAKELASKKIYSSRYLTGKKVANKNGNKKKIICSIAVVAVILTVGLSVAVFFFSSFLQSPKEDLNILAYKHYLATIENAKSHIEVSVDSLVNLTVAEIDSSYQTKKRAASRKDSLSADIINKQIAERQSLDFNDQQNRANVDSFIIPFRYASRIVGLLKKHEVKRGETLRSISLLYYGKKKYSNYIFVYNRKQLFSPDDLRYGIVIDIPNIKGIRTEGK